MRKLSQIWFEIQEVLFPFIEKEIEEPLTKKLKQLISTLELIRIEDMVRVPEYWQGQSPRNRKQIARAFVAKAVYNMDTTRGLIDRLKISPVFRRICGWQKVCDVPHESSFSRAFKEFSESGLTQIVHKRLIKQQLNSKGYKKSWVRYKLYIDAAEGHIPISCVLTSASVHDSQVALPHFFQLFKR